jgi:hypothetical protein
MAPPNATRPAPALTGIGPLEDDRLAGSIFPTNTNDGLLSQLEAARVRLDKRTDTLNIIADQRDDLRRRIAYAKLRFQLVGIDPDEIEQLQAEVAEFKRVCRTLAWTGGADASRS